MLSSKEKYVMKYLYQKCHGKKSSLIAPREVISYVSDKYVMMNNELDNIMTNLTFDNYIDFVRSEKKGETIFVVSLKMKGEGFYRELSNNRRTWYFVISRTVLLAVLSWIFGLIIKALF